MLRSATARSSRLLLLQRSHAASLSQEAGAGAGSSSPPFLKTDASTTFSNAFSYSACQGDADAQGHGRVDRHASAQGVVTQRQPTDIGSARGGSASHRKVGSLLGVLPRPSGYLVSSLASAQAHLKRSLSSHAEQPAESPVAEEREQQVSLETVADGQSVAPTKTRKRPPFMPYIEGLPQAWPEKVPSAVRRARRVRADDGTLASARRIYGRECERRQAMHSGDFSVEELALADAAVQKSRGILNSRRADPLNAEEEAQHKAKRNAFVRQLRALARERNAPIRKAVVIDEDASSDRRLFPLYHSAPPDDLSIKAAHAQKARARHRLKCAQIAQLDADELARFEQALRIAQDVYVQRYYDPRNAEERRARLARGPRKRSDKERIADAARQKARYAQRRASKGLAPFISMNDGLIKSWADHAASQGRTLPPRGLDDGSVVAAYRLYTQAGADVQRLRKNDAHSDDMLKALAARQENMALFKARLEDPANAQERQVYEAQRKRQNRRGAEVRAKRLASKSDSALGQA